MRLGSRVASDDPMPVQALLVKPLTMDRSSRVRLPEVLSIGSGSATMMASMRRPASSTATATRASSWSVAVAAATERIVATVAGASPRSGCFRSTTTSVIVEFYRLPVRHVANEQAWSKSGCPIHGARRPQGRRLVLTNRGNEAGGDAHGRSERRKLRTYGKSASVTRQRDHSDRVRVLHLPRGSRLSLAVLAAPRGHQATQKLPESPGLHGRGLVGLEQS